MSRSLRRTVIVITLLALVAFLVWYSTRPKPVAVTVASTTP